MKIEGENEVTGANAQNETKEAVVKPVPSKAVASVPTHQIRIPLQIFKDHLEILPASVQKKARKAGTHKISDKREWGPEIGVTAEEAKQLQKVGEDIYRDQKFDKSTKTFGYQLRKAASEITGISIQNIRKYTRRPKPEPVADNVNVQQEQLAAAMPPVNVERVNTLLNIAMSAMEDNGQKGIAQLLGQLRTELDPVLTH